MAKKSAAKKATAKKTVARKTAGKKTAARKTAAKKSGGKKKAGGRKAAARELIDTGSDKRFVRRTFAWEPFICREARHVLVEARERKLIAKGRLRAHGFQYVGER